MTKNNPPLVSIITPSWNSAEYIERTIQSVIGQTYPAIEHLIIDGGSNDGTCEIIKRYEADLSYWVSEPDSGMYDALNKGMQRAQGEIVAYLNSDDLYFPDTISRVVRLFEQNPEADLIYGDLLHIDESDRELFVRKYPDYDWATFTSADYAMIGQPAAFWKKDLHDRVGGFDASLKMAADFDYFIRAGLSGNLLHTPEVLAAFRLHAQSLTGSQLITSTREVEQLHSKYFPKNGALRKWRAVWSDLTFKLLNWRAFLARLKNKLRGRP